jgi:hypothetical protein
MNLYRPIELLNTALNILLYRLSRPEVELPGGDALRHVSPAVQEGQPQLDDLEQVHVAAQQLVLVVGARLEVSDWPTTDYYS